MKELFEQKVNLILIVVVLIVAVLIIIPTASRGCATSTSNGEIVTSPATPDEAETTEPVTESSTAADVEIKDSKVTIKPKKASSSTSKNSASKVFATAETAETKADYDTQWDSGYLIAVDNPDLSYYCGHVELTDKDRELLEKFCMGEFKNGGFTGAALVAQAVKDAMYFDDYTSVQDVIDDYHYEGKLNKKPSQKVKDAVVYVFDMEGEAVQHRILYMYNPKNLDSGYSKFHEKQNYICTFKEVRVFDRKEE